MYADDTVLNRLSGHIVGCAFVVANTLGQGFLEKVYENALALELRDLGLAVEQQRGIAVLYKGESVGHYVADMLVERAVIVEVKATKTTDPGQMAQCRHYPKATGVTLCLLINFGGPRVEVKRIVWTL